jgi:hypothetical protein
MARLSSLLVVVALRLSSASVASAQGFTCDPTAITPESYRLSTEAQALNLTRPRTNWWDAFDASLRTHREALADINEAALVIAERALAIDPHNQLAQSQRVRQMVVLGENGDRARDDIRELFAGGGAIAWTATLYDVDARSFFVMGFDRAGIHVFRFGALAPNFTRRLGVPEFPGPEATALWRAWGGCFDAVRAEATVPWSDVREIAAGNYVLWFKFNTPVSIGADSGKRKSLKEFKVALHGAMGTVFFRETSRDNNRWDEPTVSGVGVGPSAYQERIRRTLVAVVDPAGRISLPKQKRGAGW